MGRTLQGDGQPLRLEPLLPERAVTLYRKQSTSFESLDCSVIHATFLSSITALCMKLGRAEQQ